VFYWLTSFVIRFIRFQTVQVRTHGIPENPPPGGYLLACAHVSHLDPFCIGSVWPRKICWLARIEFYRKRWSAWCMRRLNTIAINRQGVPVRAIREALSRLRQGHVIGIFPEGEIKSGSDSALRGAPIKRGVCLLSVRSGRPILPCVVVGTEKLLRINAYLPFRRSKLWVVCGDWIHPVAGTDRREARAKMAAQLEQAYQRLFADLQNRWHLHEDIAP
jgi:1-acyl-sn-glycerol-3-phosphate acyltransferase